MQEMNGKTYILVVQCHIVKEVCSGYFCEKSFHERADGFKGYPKDAPLRILCITCGGCCGKAVHRKISNFLRKAGNAEGITKDQVVVHLSSCMTKDNYHAPRCPNIDYVKALIARHGLEVREDTHLSPKAEERRRAGAYKPLSR
jgi:predicted metal-binding protein